VLCLVGEVYIKISVSSEQRPAVSKCLGMCDGLWRGVWRVD
jgi:hypothetical protein